MLSSTSRHGRESHSDQNGAAHGHLDKRARDDRLAEIPARWTPLLEDGKLYSRSECGRWLCRVRGDDGSAGRWMPNISRPRCVDPDRNLRGTFGSFDLPPYLDALAPRMATSASWSRSVGAGSADAWWATTSLRGLVNRHDDGAHADRACIPAATPAAPCRPPSASRGNFSTIDDQRPA